MFVPCIVVTKLRLAHTPLASQSSQRARILLTLDVRLQTFLFQSYRRLLIPYGFRGDLLSRRHGNRKKHLNIEKVGLIRGRYDRVWH